MLGTRGSWGADGDRNVIHTLSSSFDPLSREPGAQDKVTGSVTWRAYWHGHTHSFMGQSLCKKWPPQIPVSCCLAFPKRGWLEDAREPQAPQQGPQLPRNLQLLPGQPRMGLWGMKLFFLAKKCCVSKVSEAGMQAATRLSNSSTQLGGMVNTESKTVSVGWGNLWSVLVRIH